VALLVNRHPPLRVTFGFFLKPVASAFLSVGFCPLRGNRGGSFLSSGSLLHLLLG
jgi:hypothetical protein